MILIIGVIGMKRIVLSLLVVFLFASSFNAEDGKKFGNDLTVKEKTLISKILETPNDFVGKKVLVEGTVVGVCKKRGCWIDIASDKEYEKIRIKVNDGEIVFPMELKGKTALVEGEVYVIQPHPEHKKDNEKEGDECVVPEVKYQIKGLGAVVK